MTAAVVAAPVFGQATEGIEAEKSAIGRSVSIFKMQYAVTFMNAEFQIIDLSGRSIDDKVPHFLSGRESGNIGVAPGEGMEQRPSVYSVDPCAVRHVPSVIDDKRIEQETPDSLRMKADRHLGYLSA